MEISVSNLKRIFPDRSEDELRIILRRHNGDENQAAESIILGEMAVLPMEAPVSTTPERSTAAPTPSVASVKPTTSEGWWDSPTICTPPPLQNGNQSCPNTTNGSSIEQRQEEKDFEAALEASKNPSDKGRLAGYGDLVAGQAISDETLADLMRNPAFCDQMDDDLKAAIQLQLELDAQERTSKESFSPSVRQRLQSLGATFLQRAATMREEQRLVAKLEAMNEQNQKITSRQLEMDRIKREAEMACMEQIESHLDSFLLRNPNGQYEQWITELHPENAHIGMLLEGLSKTIDHRFYVEDSDHRVMWNQSVDDEESKKATTRRLRVPARYSPSRPKTAVDLLAEGSLEDASSSQNGATKENSLTNKINHSISATPTTKREADLLSFD